MDYILYLLIFCIGAVFGSFYTLAVYRIPLRQDITHTRSYCPKCNHKLSFFDMIPILSYIFLGGKCRYCKQKIRPRYFLLEILSGVVFVLFAISIKFNVLSVILADRQLIIYMITGLLYISTLFIIAGIDKENIKIERPVLLFGFICVSLYMMYLYIVEKEANMYRYVIYLAVYLVLTVVDTVYTRKTAKQSYTIGILLLLNIIGMFTYEIVCIYTIAITLILIAVKIIVNKIKVRKHKCVKSQDSTHAKLPIGFYMCASNITTLITSYIFIFYYM